MTATDRPVVAPRSTWRTLTAFWWLALSALAVAVLAPLPYALVPLAELARNGSEVAAHYAERSPGLQLALLLHAGAGGLALLLAPLQFAARLRDRAPAVHRRPGTTPRRAGWAPRRGTGRAGRRARRPPARGRRPAPPAPE